MPCTEKDIFSRTVTTIIFLLLISELPLTYSKTNIPGPASEVKMLMGRPTFFIDDKAVTEPLFSTYQWRQKFLDEMADSGCNMFNFVTTCADITYGHAKTVWIAPDKWDFSQMDDRARMALKARPDALLMPRIFIEAPKWWREQNPGELVTLDNGNTTYTEPYNDQVIPKGMTFGSIASKKYREDMAFALRKTIEHMESSDWGKHITGYQISSLGSEEWYHYGVNQVQMSDYSPHMREAFQKWLQDKYGTVENLRNSWNKPDIDFKTVELPTPAERKKADTTFRDPKTEMNVIDFNQFYSDIIVETMDYFAKVIKDATDNKKVVGAYYGYFYEFGGYPEFGHNATLKSLQSKYIDFILEAPCHYARELGTGAVLYRRPFLSGTLHNKLWYHDNDAMSHHYRTVLEQHIGNPKGDTYVTTARIEQIGKNHAVQETAQQTIWEFQRAAGFVLCEGIYESYFDLHGGYYDDPRLLNAFTDLTEMFARSKKYDRSSIAEVIVVADERSAAYLKYATNERGAIQHGIGDSLRSHQLGFIKAGAPFDSVFLDDLPLVNMDQYKMIVFLNTYHISDQIRDFIHKKVAGNKRTIIWCYAPGYFNDNSQSTEQMKKLTGIRIIPDANEQLIAPQSILTSTAKEWMKQLGEKPIEEPIGQAGKVCKLFYVKDSNAQPLGTLSGSEAVTMAKKDIGNWTSIYLISAALPPNFVL